MTTRRGRSSGSGQPGTAVWRNGVQRLKRDLTEDDGWAFERLEVQDRKLLAKWVPLIAKAEALRIEELLTYMNDNLLESQGLIEKTFRWEISEPDDLDDDEEADDDDDDTEDDMEDVYGLAEIPVLSIVLSWKQAGRIQINVELVGTLDGVVMRIDGDEMDSATSGVLQRGLIGAFEEHSEFIEGPDEEDEDDEE